MNLKYFSKWREKWVDFEPTKGELLHLKEYRYRISMNGVETDIDKIVPLMNY